MCELNDVDLYNLTEYARATKTDALLLTWRDAQVVGRFSEEGRGLLPLQSVTKSVVSLGVGIALEEAGQSVDTPLAFWYPDWSTGKKSLVTIRHILTHTSGIIDPPHLGGFFAVPSALEYVRSLEVRGRPGKEFAYSNQAVELLSGIVRALSGEPVEEYIHRRLFQPLGITEWSWEKDNSGDARLAGGLALSAFDLAKVGTLVLRQGAYYGKRVVPRRWIVESTRTASIRMPPYGLLWGLRESQSAPSGKGDVRVPVVSCFAQGWGGQYLVVVPESKVVAVRLRALAQTTDPHGLAKRSFATFVDVVGSIGVSRHR